MEPNHSFRRAAIIATAALAMATAAAGATLPDLNIFEWSTGLYPGANQKLSPRISNNGGAPVTTDVTFYRGSVNAGTATQIERQTVALAAYETKYVYSAVSLNLVDGDVFSVCVDATSAIAESNERNNCEVRVISTNYSDLSVDVRDISMAPVGANVGEPVKVSANIRNNRAVASKALVRLFQGHPTSPSAKLLGKANVSVPANGVGAASWTIIRPDGDTNLFVSVDDVYPRENSRPDNIASRNMFLKAIVDTGRIYNAWNHGSTYPAVGDLLGTGQPVMVFAEHTGNYTAPTAQLTAMQILSDGTTKELWSKVLVQGSTQMLAPSIADLDGDGSPEIIVQVRRDLTDANGVNDGEIYVFALDKNGNTKWMHKWRTAGRRPCGNFTDLLTVLLGDMNKDGVADVVYAEKELVILDGRNGAELARNSNLPASTNWCTTGGAGAIADLDGDGSNEIIIGKYGIHVFNSNGALRYSGEANNIYHFALIDVDKDGKPELVLPVHRQRFDIVDAATGALKKRNVPSPWSPFADTIAVTTSLDANGYPTVAIANNDYTNGTGLLDNQLNIKWWVPTPLPNGGTGYDNPQHIALADLLGIGRPQVISRSDRRSIGIQDIQDGKWLFYGDIFGFGLSSGEPIPVDVDGDGRGEVIVSYGQEGTGGTKLDFEAQYHPVNYLIFGSDHWKKIPTTWNQTMFVPNQVDRKLAFRHDYQPYKTHNTWMQQPMRQACDIDFDDDVDQNDINLIYNARGTAISAGDWRDIDKDGQITVNDARACTLKCTKPNCAIISQPARILSISPRRAFPGSTVQVTIRGEFVNFKAGQTTANFGPGISVNGAAAGTNGVLTVIDAETATANLAIAAGQTGDRAVTVTTGTTTATNPQGFSLSAGNRPPVVSVSPDQTVIFPGSVTVSGAVTDDGQPNGQVTTSWQMIGGPGIVTFAAPNALSTSVSFSKDGFYVLRLSATDGQYVASADLGITVILSNQAPQVTAGPDLATRQDSSLTIAGQVQDDGLPVGGSMSVAWTKVSGPGTVTFTPATQAHTSVAFSVPGTYVLRLSASDSQMTGSDDVTVVVNPPAPQILSLTPNSGAPGQAVSVTIQAKYTSFAAGSTQADFGPGVTVNQVSVVNAATVIANVTVSSGATLGARPVTLKTGTEQATLADAFTVGAIGASYTVRLNLTDRFLAPGGAFTARPQVLDAAANVINTPGQAFTLSVTPKAGQTTGSAPVVNGLTASFPKLAKRLKNWDSSKDPEGKWTDGDKTDPNYGKETGGIYTATVKLNGTAVSGSIEVVVLPSGTADLTARVPRFASDLGAALDVAKQALSSHDGAAIVAARGQVNNVANDRAYSVQVLATNNVLAPPNGFPVPVAQLTGKFPAQPDDATLAAALDANINQIRAIRARIESITPSSVSQADVDALRAAANTYKTIAQQLGALRPGPLGVTTNSRAVNQLLRLEMPKLFEVMARKSAQLMNSLDLGSVQTTNTTKLAAGVHEASLVNTAFPVDAVLNVFSELFGVFTDLAGYAKGNIIELGISLANDLANIALSGAINAYSPGGLAIDYIVGGAQFSFVCPNFPDSYVEASGFSPNLEDNSVAVIGCLNSNALRTMLTLSPVEDMAAAIRLMFDIKGLADTFGSDQGIAALAQPDEQREGLFGGSEVVFHQGWPKVNQGRLPCVGVVIAFNIDSGSFHSQNANMLPDCN